MGSFNSILPGSYLLDLGNDYWSNACIFTFDKLPFYEKTLAISTGQRHVLILTINGLFFCGDNEHGQLGIGIDENIEDRGEPCVVWTLTKSEFFNNKSIISTSCGVTNSIVLTNEGLFGCGQNFHCQLNRRLTHFHFEWIRIEFSDEPIICFSCPYRNTFVLTEKNLWCCGENEDGQLGLGDIEVTKDFTQSLIKV
jgi:alpha-tubulin suppressor-like RCC1 family protein